MEMLKKVLAYAGYSLLLGVLLPLVLFVCMSLVLALCTGAATVVAVVYGIRGIRRVGVLRPYLVDLGCMLALLGYFLMYEIYVLLVLTAVVILACMVAFLAHAFYMALISIPLGFYALAVLPLILWLAFKTEQSGKRITCNTDSMANTMDEI